MSALPDAPIVALSITAYIGYHAFLLFNVFTKPELTVIGITRKARANWIAGIMSKQDGSLGVLAIQTLRNYLMISSAMGSVAITLSVAIMAVVGSLSGKSSEGTMTFLSGFSDVFKINIAILIATFVCAFVCFLESMRYMNHTGFIITTVPPKQPGSERSLVRPDKAKAMVLLATRMVNRGALFHTFGIRFLLYAFPVLSWLFSPWALLVTTVLLLVMCYVLDEENAEGFGGRKASEIRLLQRRLGESQDEEMEINPLSTESRPTRLDANVGKEMAESDLGTR
ncbi:hypothetical protein SmJEL517_g02210 [Synchytrium microbalum]|uniref:DUF599 domain-containing protein n=1 Tax=Synchytrium microbalum TaxID=1806994 RepID=A0A507CB85_9FUNG|nr:uncharacterized protein SmJEL517_g02210 [Synchytrium microbalum]TPX35266.1 hypothetical protein SmJEL517_g02210 [Synchytrium microbalum]